MYRSASSLLPVWLIGLEDARTGPTLVISQAWEEGQGDSGKSGGGGREKLQDWERGKSPGFCCSESTSALYEAAPCFDASLFLHKSDLHVALPARAPFLPFSMSSAQPWPTVCSCLHMSPSVGAVHAFIRFLKEAMIPLRGGRNSVLWLHGFSFCWWLSIQFPNSKIPSRIVRAATIYAALSMSQILLYEL